MIYTENVMISGKEFVHTYSDTFLISRDGVLYDDAYDPAGSGRVYIETDTRLPQEEISDEEALAILTGEGGGEQA